MFKIQPRLTVLLSLMALLLIAPARAEFTPIAWTDLIPEDIKEDTVALIQSTRNPMVHTSPDLAPQRVNPDLLRTVAKFHGKTVRLAGFMVPLDGDDQGPRTLLLAPYAGACIHVPPPPPNQLIYIEMEEGEFVPWDYYNEPFYIEGEITIEHVDGEMAQTSYTIRNARFEPYSG